MSRAFLVHHTSAGIPTAISTSLGRTELASWRRRLACRIESGQPTPKILAVAFGAAHRSRGRAQQYLKVMAALVASVFEYWHVDLLESC